MDAIHIIMATTTSANPHNAPNERIESIVRKRKISAATFLVFGTLLIIAGSLLASFESQRFSVSFVVFGIIGILFAFMYWISAERILIALRKYNTDRMREIQLQAQSSGTVNLGNTNNENFTENTSRTHTGLPSYEQSVLSHIEIPPPYEEAIKIESIDPSVNNSSQSTASIPINSISLSVDRATNISTTSRASFIRDQSTSQ